MRLRNLLPVLLVLLLLLIACNQETTPAADVDAPTDAAPTITTADEAREPADRAAAYPAPQDAAPGEAETVVDDAGDATEPVVAAAAPSDELLVDTGELPVVPTVLAVEDAPYRLDSRVGPTGLPAHWRVEFAPASEGEPAVSGSGAILYVIPVEAYRALWAEAGDMGVDGTLTALIMTIEDGLRPFQDGGVPGLPVEHVGTAFNDLAAQGDYLALDNVTGLRFVGRFVAEPAVVTNEGLTYVFLGFTNDGSHLISFFYPVTSAALPDDAADVDPAVAERFETDPFAYLAEQAAALNELDPDAFSPPLAALDAVVASLAWAADQGPAVAAAPEAEEEAGDGDLESLELPALANSTWQWIALEQAGATTTIDDSSRYTVQFGEDGSVGVNAGCHVGQGSFETADSGALAIVLNELSLQPTCPPAYLDAVLVGGLGNTAGYALADTELRITLQNENGVLTFVRVTP